VESVVNRYYDPTTGQFVSVDPMVQETDQPYVFVNDNPLNGTDPLGLCFIVCLHSVAKAFDAVTKFVSSNTVAVVGLSLDATAFGVEALGAVADDATISAAGATIGFTGAVVSAVGCKESGGLACIGTGVGSVAATAGIVETGLELSEVAPGAAAALQGVGLTFGGTTLTLDLAAVIVKVHNAVCQRASKSATRAHRKQPHMVNV
jgi:hypothetical protein